MPTRLRGRWHPDISGLPSRKGPVLVVKRLELRGFHSASVRRIGGQERGGYAGFAAPVPADPRSWSHSLVYERRDVSSMLTGILFLVLIVAVAVLITVDVVRAPNEAPIGPGDRHAHDAERTLAARGADGITGFSREPAAREQSVPSAVAEARI